MTVVAKKQIKGTEFNRGTTYERYSGENTRSRVTAEGAALGSVAAGAGLASSSLAGAKLAGTPIGQSALGAAHAKLETSARLTKKPEQRLAADQVRRYKNYGAAVGRHKLKTSAAILGLGGTAALARIGQRHRQNEEAGISQGIGRMKSGEHYSGVQRRATFGKIAGMAPVALATDVLAHPKIGPILIENKHKITAAGIGAAGVVGGITAARSGQKHKREYRQLRGELKPTGKVVASKGGPQFALAGLLTGGAGLGAGAGVKRRDKEKGREVQAATIGGWAGQGAYQGAMYGTKHTALRSTKRATDIANPERKMSRNHLEHKILKPHKAEHGMGTTDYYRHYPSAAPAWRRNRVTGYLGRGKLGTAVGATATAAGSAAGAKVVSGRGSGHGKKEHVEKLYVRDQQTSMTHLLGAAAGLGLGAWGFGRSRMVGAALGRGIKVAQGHQNPYAIQALQAAQSLQGVLARGTAPGERALRQIRAVDQAVSRVPSALRPEIALAAGTLLVGHSRPIRRESYHPVNVRVRTFGGY